MEEQGSKCWWFNSLLGCFVSQLFNIISILFPVIHGKTIRENSLLYKNVTSAYHRYKGLVPYFFCSAWRRVEIKLTFSWVFRPQNILYYGLGRKGSNRGSRAQLATAGPIPMGYLLRCAYIYIRCTALKEQPVRWFKGYGTDFSVHRRWKQNK